MMMCTALRTGIIALGLTIGAVAAASAQDKPASPPKPTIAVKVDVVLSRFQGDKKISSLPYTLWISTGPGGGGSSLRVGVDVPVGTKSETDNKGSTPNSSTTLSNSTVTTQPVYHNVGTSIDTRIFQALDDGRFSVYVYVVDSSIFDPDQQRRQEMVAKGLMAPSELTPKAPDSSSFRTFTMSNTLPMRDGQTLQFATATDKITGETLKVDVTISVAK